MTDVVADEVNSLSWVVIQGKMSDTQTLLHMSFGMFFLLTF